MGSTRLPGKVLLEAGGQPLLEHLVQRLKLVPSIDEVIIATTTNQKDEQIVDFAEKRSIKFYRGSEENVMSRVLEAAKTSNADVVVEITGDCPLIDPDIVEQTIRLFIQNKVDYASNAFYRCYPGGMDTEVISRRALEKSFSMTNDPYHLEHVSTHIVDNPDLFSHVYLIAPPSLTYPEFEFIVDEEDDYKLVKEVIEILGSKNKFFSCIDMINLLKNNHEIAFKNSRVNRNNTRPTCL